MKTELVHGVPTSAFVEDWPFTVRWMRHLARAMNEGGWHMLHAAPQSGKTTASRLFHLSQSPRKGISGEGVVPVAVAWPSPPPGRILRPLALSLGGEQLARLPNREMTVPAAIKRLGTKLLIINNSHMLEPKQYEELIRLDDVCLGNFGRRPAVVLSGIHPKLELGDLPRNREIRAQIEKRIVRRQFVHGMDKEETRKAISQLLRRNGPDLLRDGADKCHLLVFDLLTRPNLSNGSPYVLTGDLVLLLRRAVSVRTVLPTADLSRVFRKAFDDHVLAVAGESGPDSLRTLAGAVFTSSSKR